MAYPYKNNDARAIYSRGVFAGHKNWRMKWAIKLAKKNAKNA